MIRIQTRIDTKPLDRLIANLPKATERAVRDGCETIREEAQRLVPVRTGATQRSIHCEPWQTHYQGFPRSGWLRRNEFTGLVGPTTPYALFLEMGTCKMSPRAFITPAVEYARRRILESFRQIAGGRY